MPDTNKSVDVKCATVQVYDMAAVVHMVKPNRASSFSEYTPKHIIPFLEAQLTDSMTRVDAVWNTYPEKTHMTHKLI